MHLQPAALVIEHHICKLQIELRRRASIELQGSGHATGSGEILEVRCYEEGLNEAGKRAGELQRAQRDAQIAEHALALDVDVARDRRTDNTLLFDVERCEVNQAALQVPPGVEARVDRVLPKVEKDRVAIRLA